MHLRLVVANPVATIAPQRSSVFPPWLMLAFRKDAMLKLSTAGGTRTESAGRTRRPHQVGALQPPQFWRRVGADRMKRLAQSCGSTLMRQTSDTSRVERRLLPAASTLDDVQRRIMGIETEF